MLARFLLLSILTAFPSAAATYRFAAIWDGAKLWRDACIAVAADRTDLVAVEGDPLADIEVAIRNVRWVMKAGQVVVDKTK